MSLLTQFYPGPGSSGDSDPNFPYFAFGNSNGQVIFWDLNPGSTKVNAFGQPFYPPNAAYGSAATVAYNYGPVCDVIQSSDANGTAWIASAGVLKFTAGNWRQVYFKNVQISTIATTSGGIGTSPELTTITGHSVNLNGVGGAWIITTLPKLTTINGLAVGFQNTNTSFSLTSCPLLTTITDVVFTVGSTGYNTTLSFTGNALTATSIEKILVALQKAGPMTGSSLLLNGGTNAAAATWTAAANAAATYLTSNGWSITSN